MQHAPSMYYLGVMNLYGQGVPVSYDLALQWFRTAASLVSAQGLTGLPC
jgi:TPR repeat protein